MSRLTVVQIAQILKAHCAIEFGETVFIHRLVFQHGRWDGVVQMVDGKVPIGPRFGVLISAEGDILEDALDVDSET